MSEVSSTAENDLRIAEINRIVSIVVGVIFLGVAGVAVFQFRDSHKVPDRSPESPDCWLKQLSTPSGLPEFDGAVKTQFDGLQFDTSMLQPQPLQLDFSSGQSKTDRSARSQSPQPRRRSSNSSR
ncbi:MAG: hypothetical protein U0992_13540 [Planctomycetaceae bacterium]